MEQDDTNSDVSGYLSRAYDFDADGERYDLGYLEPVTVLFDQPRGVTWEATIDRFGLASLKVTGRDINHQVLRSAPLRRLRQLAAVQEEAVEESRAPAAYPRNEFEEAMSRTREYAQQTSGPTLESFVTAWSGAPKQARRAHLSKLFNVQPPTIDKWTRKARDQGLLPPPVTGRKRASAPAPKRDPETTPTPEEKHDHPDH